ncbi:MAG: sialate O-acetylesterase [Kiritimatiellia bacterium]|nr:sialate O-acetylesterase [Kiritimatiellia bacterium]
MKRFHVGAMCLVAGGWLALCAQAVTLNTLFTEGAIVQQGVSVPVWGTAEPGETVTVTFADQTKQAMADAQGNWVIRLNPMAASAEPRVLVAIGQRPEARLEIPGVLVGEVWVCSGQSNMQWSLGQSEGGTNAAQQVQDPLFRLFKVPNIMSDTPLQQVAGRWTSSEFSNSIQASGVAFFFGRELRAARNVPVGLILTSWGGTPAEAWMPRALLESDPEFQAILDQHARAVDVYTPEKAEADFQRNLANWSNQVEKARAENRPVPYRPRLQVHPSESPTRPGSLYNAMIHPLLPYALAGAIWYQGESNAGRAKQYETLFPAMIQNWRQAWGLGDFPFLFVQIAPYHGMGPAIREAQLVAWQNTPGTMMVVTADVGEEADIHPRKKEPVGARLARAARAVAYGEDIVYSGPVYRALRVEGNRVSLEFDHIGSGLTAAEGGLQDFEIAASGTTNFVPAIAVIEGDRVIVQSPDVAAPGAVRYAWKNWFVGSLFNQEGLPATPFRTDRTP